MINRLAHVHAVTDATIARLPDIEKLATGIAQSPQVALHARIPQGDGARLIELALRLRRATGRAPIVNDRVDVARMVYAAGVHLPAAGLPVIAVREMLAANQLLGRSAHSVDDARRALDDGVDYVFLGPVWETPSHPGREPLGPEIFRELRSLKVIAIGGVTPARVTTCLEHGAWGVAAVSALWRAPDPAAAVREMLLSFEKS